MDGNTSALLRIAALISIAVTILHPSARAQDCLPGDACTPLLQSLDGSRDCAWCSSQYLTGDWCGARSALGEQGISVQADVTQFYMGVVEGGLEQEFRYSGHGDYVINMDLGKLGVQEGLFLKVRAEHRFAETPSELTGAFLPPAVLADLPTLETEHVYLTNVLLTQFLSESFAVFAGRLDTLDGDPNAFAHARGKTQFSNIAFVSSPIALRTVPYATVGAGFVVLREQEPLLTFNVLNPTELTREGAFDDWFAEGVLLASELRVPVEPFGRPGHQLIGATWNSRDFVALGQDPRIILPDVPIARQAGSWSLYWNFDQYLYVDPATPTRGWGLFGRAGIADDDTNPLAWFLSFGIGGNSPIPGREADTFGAGWYYSATSSKIGPILSGLFGPIGDGQGVELFYNVEVNPWFHVSPDVQFIVPARESVDTAVLLGVRGNIAL